MTGGTFENIFSLTAQKPNLKIDIIVMDVGYGENR